MAILLYVSKVKYSSCQKKYKKSKKVQIREKKEQF